MAQRATKADLSPWNVVALETFCTPGRTQSSQWRRSWRAATSRIGGKEASERQAKQESKLRALPEVKLAHWAPAIDWSPAASALSEILYRHQEAPLVLFISPPYGGHKEVVSHWAEHQGIDCLPTPTVGELAEGSLEWVERCDHHRRWAVPALERYFLRNTEGLQGVRKLLEGALTGRLGQGVMGCDSWTYAYLQHAVGLEGVPVFVLQALEGEQLAHYFAHLPREDDCPTVYSTRTGRKILSNGGEGEQKDVHKELQRLAAHCRGHLGIAWHYWRERLREPAENGDADHSSERSQASPESLWLLDVLAEAELPENTGDVTTLLLHTLLIHGGLEDHVLDLVLPFSNHEALNARLSLTRQGILCCDQQRWQVAPLSYASVRQLLESRHYLVDPL